MASTWQHSSLEDTNLHMLENEILCDITFLVGEEREPVKCHKYMLVSRSPVFYSMFCGTLAELGDTVSVPDSEPEIWKLFLRFLYGWQSGVDSENVCRLLYLAKKYGIQTLLEKCKTYLKNNIDVNNVCTILDQAIAFDEKELSEKCMEVVSHDTLEVFKSEDFLSLSKKGLKTLLKLDRMSISGEEDVYAACKKWAANAVDKQRFEGTNDKNLRNAVTDVLPLIRFPTMSSKTFIGLVAVENILNDTEKVLVIRDILNEESVSGFSKEYRTVEKHLVTRMLAVSESWCYDGSMEGISFTVSRLALLTDVALYLPISHGDLTGQIELYENETLVTTNKVALQYKEGVKFELVPLTKAVSLHPKDIYSIRLSLKGQRSFYGGGYAGKQNIANLEIEFLNLHVGESVHGTRPDFGLIHGVQITV